MFSVGVSFSGLLVVVLVVLFFVMLIIHSVFLLMFWFFSVLYRVCFLAFLNRNGQGRQGHGAGTLLV